MKRDAGARFLPLLAVALMSMAVSVSDAFARPSICIKLERQLAAAGGQGASANVKYSNAARAQAQQLQIARGQARRAGCGGSIVIFGGGESNKAACARLTSTIRKMESNLAKLQNKANAGGGGDVSKARIRAALDANDCYGQPVEVSAKKRTLPAPVETGRRGLFSQLFGGGIEPRRTDSGDENSNIREVSANRRVKVTLGNGDDGYAVGASGTYRTLCVRTCDGYYFPVSFSTTSSHFDDDEKACAALCPGAETSLYYHSVPDQEPEEMISLAKEPYTKLPTAFKYRIDGIAATPGCTCQAQAKAETADDASGAVKTPRWIPIPAVQPGQLDDAESALNRAGNLDPAAVAYLIEGRAPEAGVNSGRKIRVVGPVYLPAQTKAEELPIPGRVTVQ